MFKDDGGGFKFACDDCKISLDASTWATRLSQISKISGQVWILTHNIIDIEYVSDILRKRPENIFMVAHVTAKDNAIALKAKFSGIKIALHNKIGAKAVLIEPGTIWISSADFGLTRDIESTIGIHSIEAYQKYLELHVKRIWMSSLEVM